MDGMDGWSGCSILKVKGDCVLFFITFVSSFFEIFNIKLNRIHVPPE